MVKSTIYKQNTEEARQMANIGIDWARDATEESIERTASMIDRGRAIAEFW